MEVFCSPFRGPVALLDPWFCVFWSVLSLPSVCFWSFCWFLSCCLLCVCLSVCVSACDSAVVFSLAFVCRLWCCGVSLLAVFGALWGGSPPPLAVVSLPLRLFPCDVLVQLLCHCRTAWGAREQQKSACMVRSLADENQWLCNLPTLRVSGTCFGWHCWRLLCILQCTAGLSGTMTPWNVVNSSAVGPFYEPCNNQCYVDESKDGMTRLLRRSHIVCGRILLSKCGVIILYGSMQFACLLTILHGFLPFERCLRMRITTGWARSFVQVCTFPLWN